VLAIAEVFALPPITRLGIEKGLSNNSVRVVYQDKKVFIWLGTYDGLNRYDGSEFKVFRNKLNDSTSLPHNYIYSIHEDADNNLWIGSGQGIVKYNQTYSNFSPLYGYPYLAKQPVKITINATSIKSGQDGSLLLATNGWGLMIKKKEDQYAREVPLLIGNQKLNGYNVRDILVDKEKVWVFVSGRGLCLYDAKLGQVVLVSTDVKQANCMLQNKAGQIWIGGESGLHLFDPNAKKYIRSYTGRNNELSSQDVITIVSISKINCG
jgi:ligand-binding sensor domain-containing protein